MSDAGAMRVRMAKCGALVSILASAAFAGEPVPGLGDALRVFIPVSGLAATVALGDRDGMEQWAYSIGSGQAITEVLKVAVGERRPDGGRGNRSFPSGHTSAAFGGAAFIQQRYGWRYAVPAYLGATYTGWSRMELDKHYPHDVWAGAAVGVLSAYLFTSPNERQRVDVFHDQGTTGFQVNWKW